MSIVISLVLFAVSVFLLALSVRFGLKNVARLDNYFSQKNNSNYPGFLWFYRIPFAVGVIPEYFYAVVLSYQSYFKRNWWPLKTASFISVLVLVATLKNRSAVFHYFSLGLVKKNGISALFTSGNFVMFLNVIVLLFVGLFVLLCIESYKMHGVYAPVRILAYGLLCFLMADLTIITISIIIFFTVIYIFFKILKFIFYSYRYRRRYGYYDDEPSDQALAKGYREFKADLYAWEKEVKTEEVIYNETTPEPTERKKPKITRRRIASKRSVVSELHPDKPT